MAYVNLGQVIYPIGAIFASTSPISPSSMFGGTWSQIVDDACLMAGTTIGNVGSKKITIAQMPSHNHPLTNILGCGWDGSSAEGDRLLYGRYKSGRILREFGDSSYQGGARLLALLLQMPYVETHCLAVRSELASQAKEKNSLIAVMLYA